MSSKEDNGISSTSAADKLLEKYAPVLKNLIRYSSAVNAKDISFYKSIDSSIKNKSEEINSSVVDIMNNILMSASTITQDQGMDLENIKFQLDSESENNQVISNILDNLLETVELNLDNHYKAKNNKNFKGLGKEKATTQHDDDGYTYLDPNENTNPSNTIVPRGAANMEKPQIHFQTPVDNFESSPFKPQITFKPNAIKSLEDSLQLVEPTDEVPLHYENPYAYEIMNSEYPEWILHSVPEEERYVSIPWVGSPSAEWIDTPEQLDELLIELNKCKVIAIDLEHHDYRTYHGLTCLMQITTDTKKDYLIDPLSAALRPNLKSLNEVFTNPQIIKVLHGAFMDVIWLQRDLGLYLVSLFDTFHAAKQLSIGKYSLAVLLEEYARFRTSKKWQLADWRIRPLSEEMKDYAKADTHFLIEVFYKMHEDLLKIPNALQKTLYASRKVAIRRFEYSTFRPKNLSMSSNNEVVSTSGSVPLIPEITNKITLSYDRDLPWTNLIYSNGIPLERRPLLEILYKWRDNEARTMDESPRFIMSDFIMISLVNSFELGHEENVNVNTVMNVINKHSKFGGSYYIRKVVKELTNVIKDALIELKGVDLNKLQALNNSSIKGDENYDDNEEVNGSLNSSTNAENIYSAVKDVTKLQEQFKAFSNFYKNTINPPEKTYKIETSKADTENGIFAIQYQKNGKANFIKNKSVQDRINEVVEFFSEDMDKNVEFDIDAEELEEADRIAEAEATKQAATEEETVSNERDEIITLRKKNRSERKPIKRKAEETASSEDFALDFNKGILDQDSNDNDRRKKQKKKPSFDPYSREALADMNVPQLKKKKRVDRGKNVVFKQKK